MQVDAPHSSILVTDPPLASAKNHKKMLEEMFEKFRFSKLLMQPQAVLALISQGVPVPASSTGLDCHHPRDALPFGSQHFFHADRQEWHSHDPNHPVANCTSAFQTVNFDGKRHCFVTEVIPRAFCVFYEVKISVTEISNFFKP